MIMPSKHVNLSESLLGLGYFLLTRLKTPKTVDELWGDYRKVNNTEKFPAYHGFDEMILAICFLYSIGAITQNEEGQIQREAS